MGIPAVHAGLKRSIDQVEGIEKQHEIKQEQTQTASTSFHASQEPPVVPEEEFHIQEEMSQTAVDQLVCITRGRTVLCAH